LEVNGVALKEKLCCSFSAPGASSPCRCAPGVTLRDKVRSCEIRKTLNIEPLLIARTQRELVGPCIQNAQRKTGEANPAG